MIRIDRERCTGCGACVSDCVSGALALSDGRARSLGNSCMLCGHCVAICPAQAVEMDDYDMKEVIPYDSAAFTLNPGHFLNHVKFRRSVRRFTGQKVERDKLGRILEAGRFTATGSNRQDVRFVVVQEGMETFKDLVWEGWRRYVVACESKSLPVSGKFREYYEAHKQNPAQDRLFLGAPAAVIVSAQMQISGGLAAANLENMAVMEGLGVLYDGLAVLALGQSPEACHWLGLGDREPAAMLLMGYPAVRYLRTVPRRKADIVWR